MEEKETPQDFSPEIFTHQANDDFTKWRLQGDDIREIIEHQLRGDFLQKESINIGTESSPDFVVTDKWVSDERARILNESGVRRVASVAAFTINKATALSNVSEEDILKSCGNIELSIGRMIYDSWDDFEVKTNPSSIIKLLMELVFFHLMRSKGGGERNSLNEATMRRVLEGMAPGQTKAESGRSLWPFGGKHE